MSAIFGGLSFRELERLLIVCIPAITKPRLMATAGMGLIGGSRFGPLHAAELIERIVSDHIIINFQS